MKDFTVTENALDRLFDAMQTTGNNNTEACFRVNVDDSDELQLTVDQHHGEDRVWTKKGCVVLAMSDKLAEQFDGKTLDANAAGDFVLL